jgi:hypothetical protein
MKGKYNLELKAPVGDIIKFNGNGDLVTNSDCLVLMDTDGSTRFSTIDFKVMQICGAEDDNCIVINGIIRYEDKYYMFRLDFYPQIN